MAFVASQRTARQIVVNHDGHSWQYDFPVGSDIPVLHSGNPQWAHAMKPTDADTLTAAAKTSAIALARSKGLISEFETVGATDDHIRVRDIASGHEFTLDVQTTSSGERLIGQQVCHANPMTTVDFHMIAGRARNYAQAELHQAGKIDRVV